VTTHQEIADAIARLNTLHAKEHDDLRARQRREYHELREMCGVIGHIYTKGSSLVLNCGRVCAVCSTREDAA
jgi:hypothetical protein